MRLHRFLLDQSLVDSVIQVSDAELLHQWTRVLRYTGGEELILIDGKGAEVGGKLLNCSSTLAEFQVVSRVAADLPQESRLTLYFSPLKRELTELIFQKGTELGVTAFQPIICDRTVRDGFNPERAARILKEATEQSGRRWLPEVGAPISFKEALKVNQATGSYFATLEERETPRFSRSAVSDATQALFVGPEGGWTEQEEQLAKSAGYQSFRISNQVLRAETACLAGVALLRA